MAGPVQRPVKQWIVSVIVTEYYPYADPKNIIHHALMNAPLGHEASIRVNDIREAKKTYPDS